MDQSLLLQLAQQYGTPLYVFDADAFQKRAAHIKQALGDGVGLCFSIKANPFLLACLPHEIERLEVCSPGELEICKSLGIPPQSVIYSGVNKTYRNVQDAMSFGVGTLTAESPLHLSHIQHCAKEMGQKAQVLLRLTGGDQFGMDEDTIRRIIAERDSNSQVEIVGLHHFTGTQKRRAALIEKELTYVTDFADKLHQDYGFVTERLEYGPGLFADYYANDPDSGELALLEAVAPALRLAGERFHLTVELGRFLASPCGFYITTVEDVKCNRQRHYAIADGGAHQVNYDGLMFASAPPPLSMLNRAPKSFEPVAIYGSLCSRGDLLAKDVTMDMRPGDVLCFHRAGAYAVTEGMALFLSRDLPAVVVWSQDEGSQLMRAAMETAVLNTPHLGGEGRLEWKSK